LIRSEECLFAEQAYHTANDERKEILRQLNDARGTLNVVNMQVDASAPPAGMGGVNKSESFMTNEGSMTSGSKNTFSGNSVSTEPTHSRESNDL